MPVEYVSDHNSAIQGVNAHTDVDAVVIALDHYGVPMDAAFYGHLTALNGAIEHSGDDTNKQDDKILAAEMGSGHLVDASCTETVLIDLASVPTSCHGIVCIAAMGTGSMFPKNGALPLTASLQATPPRDSGPPVVGAGGPSVEGPTIVEEAPLCDLSCDASSVLVFSLVRQRPGDSNSPFVVGPSISQGSSSVVLTTTLRGKSDLMDATTRVARPLFPHVDEAVFVEAIANQPQSMTRLNVLFNKLDYQTAIIKFKIISASNLIGVDRSGTSDPYVKVTHDHGALQKTPVIKGTLNPDWSKQMTSKSDKKKCKFKHVQDLECFRALPKESVSLTFMVKDWNRIMKNKTIGEARVCLDPFLQTTEKRKQQLVVPLCQPGVAGEHGAAGTLTIEVKTAFIRAAHAGDVSIDDFVLPMGVRTKVRHKDPHHSNVKSAPILSSQEFGPCYVEFEFDYDTGDFDDCLYGIGIVGGAQIDPKDRMATMWLRTGCPWMHTKLAGLWWLNIGSHYLNNKIAAGTASGAGIWSHPKLTAEKQKRKGLQAGHTWGVAIDPNRGLVRFFMDGEAMHWGGGASAPIEVPWLQDKSRGPVVVTLAPWTAVTAKITLNPPRSLDVDGNIM